MVRPSRALLTRTGVASLSATLALLVAACGSSHPAQAGANIKLTSAITRVSDAWPLSKHVVTHWAFPGLLRSTSPTVVSNPAAWAAVERAPSRRREAARLRALGFVRAIDEQLHARFPLMAEAISVAEQYRSSGGARAELTHQSQQLEHSRGEVSAFATGIPGAHGVRVASAAVVGLNVLFSLGPYYYVVAAGYPSDAPSAPTSAQVDAAAGTLYLAITGCAAPVR
jgi:hypothetical protein